MSSKDSTGFKLVVVLAAGAVLFGAIYARKRLSSETQTPKAVASSAPVASDASADIGAVREVASAPASSASPTEDRAALLQAVVGGDVAKLDELRQRGVAMTDLLTPAVRGGHPAVVAWLIDHGVDVHEDENASLPPVLIAENNDEIVLLLLGRGAKEPTLLQAIHAQAPKTVLRLLSKKVDPNVVDDTGAPAIQVAVVTAEGAARVAIVKSLLEAGAKVDRPVVDAAAAAALDPVLTVAIREVEIGSAGALDVVKLLVPKAPIDRDAMSVALGMRSAQREQVLDALLAGKIPPETAYRGVALAKDPALIARIAAGGVAWTTKDPYIEEPPLLDAAHGLDLARVQALVAAGAPVDAPDESGETPLMAAVSAAPPDAEDGAKIVALLLGKGANPNRKAKDGRRPLFLAAGRGSEAIVKALLAKGAAVNDDVNGVTPLDAAEEGGHDAIVTLLVAKGAKRPASRNAPPRADGGTKN